MSMMASGISLQNMHFHKDSVGAYVWHTDAMEGMQPVKQLTVLQCPSLGREMSCMAAGGTLQSHTVVGKA